MGGVVGGWGMKAAWVGGLGGWLGGSDKISKGKGELRPGLENETRILQ